MKPVSSLPAPVLASTMAIVAVNAIPLAGVVLFGWDIFAVIFLFWLENVVIGFVTILRFAALATLRGDRSALGLIPFFALHYGIFTTVHGIFVIDLFGSEGSEPISDQVAFLAIPLAAIAASRLFSFVAVFIGLGEYRNVDSSTLMMQPYSRVIVLHVTVLLGALAVEHFGAPVAALALLVLLKIMVDVGGHLREHREVIRERSQTQQPGKA